MNYTGFSTVLSRQFKTKFWRFFLASLGISVGVWSITMTTSLAQGSRDTILKAINSQPSAKNFALMKVGEKIDFFSKKAPIMIPMGDADLAKLKEEYPKIESISPVLQTDFIYKKNKNYESCWQRDQLEYKTDENGIVTNRAEIKVVAEERAKNCEEFRVSYTDLNNFVATNTGKIIGKTKDLKANEIITCYKCNNLKLNETLGATKPEEMLNKEIELTYSAGPSLRKVGEKIDYSNPESLANEPKRDIKTENKEIFKIVGVIDDRESSNFSLSFDTGLKAYMDQSYFKKAFVLANPNLNVNEYGAINHTASAKSFQDVKELTEALNNSGKYSAISVFLPLINAVNYFFLGLTVVFGIFGLIALFASVFGIINLMIVSVLERQKEIGILKALGAKNSAIFWLFLSEAMLLGVVGWIIGTLTAVLMSNGIFALANHFINQQENVKNAMLSVGVEKLTPSYPIWMLLGTLAIAVFFTTISGLIPAIRAAKQNPADVMRAE